MVERSSRRNLYPSRNSSPGVRGKASKRKYCCNAVCVEAFWALGARAAYGLIGRVSRPDLFEVKNEFNDLNISFVDGSRFETFADSEIFEHWNYSQEWGKLIIAGPGNCGRRLTGMTSTNENIGDVYNKKTQDFFMAEFTETEKSTDLAHIEELERLTGLKFPVHYKEHLLKFNGGGDAPPIFLNSSKTERLPSPVLTGV